MTDAQGPSLRLELPPDPRLLRVLRLVASGVASLGEFDLAGGRGGARGGRRARLPP